MTAGSRPAGPAGGSATPGGHAAPGRRILRAYYVTLLVLMFLPIGVLVLSALSGSGALSLPPASVSLASFAAALDDGPLLRAARNSLVVGVVAATSATLLATLLALAVARFRFRGRMLVVGLAMLPLIVPLIILAVAQFLLFRAAGVNLSLWTIAAGHTVVALPFAFLIVLSRLQGLDRNAEEAAMDLGAGRLAAIRLVVVPVIAPSIVAAWIVAFTVSFDEVALALFLAGTEPTFPVHLIGQLRFSHQLPTLIAMALLLTLGTLVLILLAERVRRVGQPLDRSGRVASGDSDATGLS